MRRDRTMTLGASIAVAICVVAAAAALRAQERRIASPTLNPARPIGSVVRPPVAVATDSDQLRRRIDALESRVAAQQSQIAELQREQAASPAGYTKAFITLGNLSRLPPSDGISYWARQ